MTKEITKKLLKYKKEDIRLTNDDILKMTEDFLSNNSKVESITRRIDEDNLPLDSDKEGKKDLTKDGGEAFITILLPELCLVFNSEYLPLEYKALLYTKMSIVFGRFLVESFRPRKDDKYGEQIDKLVSKEGENYMYMQMAYMQAAAKAAKLSNIEIQSFMDEDTGFLDRVNQIHKKYLDKPKITDAINMSLFSFSLLERSQLFVEVEVENE